ncbi:hypothetical protein GEMRC1_007048 [Eukaryota sp. GEM-RC1]
MENDFNSDDFDQNMKQLLSASGMDDISDSELLDELKNSYGWEEDEPQPEDVPKNVKSSPPSDVPSSSPQPTANPSSSAQDERKSVIDEQLQHFSLILKARQSDVSQLSSNGDTAAARTLFSQVTKFNTAIEALKASDIPTTKSIISSLKSQGFSMSTTPTVSPSAKPQPQPTVSKPQPQPIITSVPTTTKSRSEAPPSAKPPLLMKAIQHGHEGDLDGALLMFKKYQLQEEYSFYKEIGYTPEVSIQERLSQLSDPDCDQADDDNEFLEKLSTVMTENRGHLEFAELINDRAWIEQLSKKLQRLEQISKIVKSKIDIGEPRPDLSFIVQQRQVPDIDRDLLIDQLSIKFLAFDGVRLGDVSKVSYEVKFIDSPFSSESVKSSPKTIRDDLNVSLSLTTSADKKLMAKAAKMIKESRKCPSVLVNIYSELLFSTVVSLNLLATKREARVNSPLISASDKAKAKRQRNSCGNLLMSLSVRSPFVAPQFKLVIEKDCIPTNQVKKTPQVAAPKQTLPAQSPKVQPAVPQSTNPGKSPQTEAPPKAVAQPEFSEDIYDVKFLISFDVLTTEIANAEQQLAKNAGNSELELRVISLQSRISVIEAQAEKGVITPEQYADALQKAIDFEEERARRCMEGGRKDLAIVCLKRMKIMREELAGAE